MIVDGGCVSCLPYYAAYCVWVISQYVRWQELDDVVRQDLHDRSFDLVSFFVGWLRVPDQGLVCVLL